MVCKVTGCHCFILGHLTGKYETHRTLSACPLYHNTSAQECKVSDFYDWLYIVQGQKLI